jgi:hypothetical protein
MNLRSLVSLVIAVVSVLGLINVYSDNTEVEAEARQLACTGCDATLTRLERSPIAQTFYLQIDAATEAIVRCQKGAIFVGSYECEKL